LLADNSFVDLDHLAAVAHRPEAPSAHGLADTVGHEPSGLIAHAKRPMQLVGAYALLAGAHEVEGLEPFMEGDLAALHDRPHGHGEILATLFLGTAVHARPFGGVGVVDNAAMRANRAIRP